MYSTAAPMLSGKRHGHRAHGGCTEWLRRAMPQAQKPSIAKAQ